jgi:AcrR family transcriptional regulator
MPARLLTTANKSSTMAAMGSAPLPGGPAPAAPTRREQILAAAAELFAHRGFHGVGIDDIGAAVGISGPGVYRHFRSKDAVLGQMLVGISETLLAGGEERVRAPAAVRAGSAGLSGGTRRRSRDTPDTTSPEAAATTGAGTPDTTGVQAASATGAQATDATGPEAALRALVRFHVTFALDNPALITVQARDLANLAEADRRRVRRLQRQYVEVWAGAIRQVTPGCDEATGRAAAHAVFGLINSTQHGTALDRAEMAPLLERMAFGAVRALT